VFVVFHDSFEELYVTEAVAEYAILQEQGQRIVAAAPMATGVRVYMFQEASWQRNRHPYPLSSTTLTVPSSNGAVSEILQGVYCGDEALS